MGSLARGSPSDRGTASPSRLQMSTANVPAAPTRAAATPSPPPASDTLDSLLARAAQAVAEDSHQQQPTQAPAAAAAALERPGTAPVHTSSPARSAAISLAALALPRSGLGTLPGAKDSPRAQQLFQNFAASTPRAALGGGEAGGKAGAAVARPSTPSFQPLPNDRPTTAMADFSIKSGVYSAAWGAAAADEGEAQGDGAAAQASGPLAPPRRPYPRPPATAPPKADGKDRLLAGPRDGPANFGILTSAFVAAAPKGARRGTGAWEGEGEDSGAPGGKAAPQLLADLLDAANLVTKAGLRWA